DRKILNGARHIERLHRGCSALKIPHPDVTTLEEEIYKVISGFNRSVVKVIVTRGHGGRGYTPSSTSKATRIVYRNEWPEDYAGREKSGIVVCIAQHRLPRNARLSGLKHLNRLDQVLASIELGQSTADEALMLDTKDFVIEATRCNLFMVREGQLYTPDIEFCGVAGIMRSIIMELSEDLRLKPQEIHLSTGELFQADEIFLCNSIAGIWPIVEIRPSHRRLPIGEITRALQRAIDSRGYH
ncbi:MAG TPA: aminodeoxychorismate lyase, partial [Gammaproteobacteria bacterium]|nr:aminodeoxychorismate lyase [Gammaproteobacteria bacterium]